jgi:PPP family 3-phenylpropionic acid transporter
VLGIGRLLDSQPIAYLPWVIIGLLSLNWLVALTTPEAQSSPHALAPSGMLSILKKPEVIAFLLVNILLQMAHAPYYVFYSIYLKHHQYSATVTGLLWALGVVAEIVLFIYMRRLLARYRLRPILLVCILLAVVRWLLIGWCADDLGLLMLAQLLHAATFGGVHVVAIHWVQLHFGQQHQGKGQALYSSLSFGLGGGLGSLASGYYWELLGASVVYSLAASASGLAGLLAYLWVGRENAPNNAALG